MQQLPTVWYSAIFLFTSSIPKTSSILFFSLFSISSFISPPFWLITILFPRALCISLDTYTFSSLSLNRSISFFSVRFGTTIPFEFITVYMPSRFVCAIEVLTISVFRISCILLHNFSGQSKGTRDYRNSFQHSFFVFLFVFFFRFFLLLFFY